MKRRRVIIVIAVVAFAGALGWFWQSRSAKDNGSVFYGNVDIREVNLGPTRSFISQMPLG